MGVRLYSLQAGKMKSLRGQGFSTRHKKELTAQQIIEWAFRVEHARLELPRDPGQEPERWAASFGLEYVMIQRAKLGVQVDGGHSKMDQTHEDAETVAAVVAGLPDRLGGPLTAITVAECGRRGAPPDWMPGAVSRLVPVEWVERAGKPRRARTEVDHYIPVQELPTSRRRPRTRRFEVRFCPCRWEPDPQTIACARSLYTEWWHAIAYLADALAHAPLRHHRALPHLPPRAPWEQPRHGSALGALPLG